MVRLWICRLDRIIAFDATYGMLELKGEQLWITFFK